MAPAVGVFSYGPVGAQDDDFSLTNIHGGLLGYTPPPLDFHGAGGRGCHPWPCKRVPLSGTAVDSPKAAVETMAGGAQDDELFCKKMPWWIVGNKSTPTRFSWRRR